MEFANLFLDMVSGKKNGAIDAREGKKRWVFYFKNGELVLTKSNLRSEQGGALKEQYPDADMAELVHRQTSMRMGKSCGQLVQLSQTEEMAPKKMPIKTNDVFIDTFSDLMSEEDLQKVCADVSNEKLTLIDQLECSDTKITAFVNSFDGNLTTATVVARSSVENPRAWTALWLNWKLGGMEQAEKEESNENVFDFDLDDLLADGTETKAAKAPEPEPEPSEPGKHPMADKLAELEDRISSAETFFDVLGLSWEATVDQFSKEYRDLSMQLHPDRYVDADEEMQETATMLFDKIREAWEVIGDDEERKKYIDSKIHGIKTEEEEAMEQLEAIWAAEENFKRGLALFNQGRLAPAHENFEKAVELNSEDLEPKAYYGYTTFSTQRNKNMEKAMEGLDMIKEVIELNQLQEKKLDNAWMLYGKACREMGDTEKAKKILMQALRFNPSNSAAKLELRRAAGKTSGKAAEKKGKGAEKKEKKGLFGGLWGKKK